MILIVSCSSLTNSFVLCGVRWSKGHTKWSAVTSAGATLLKVVSTGTNQTPHTIATVSRSPSKTLKELRDEFFHIERVTPYPDSRNATPTPKALEKDNMALGYGDIPPLVQEYDEIFNSNSLQTYFNLSRQIGGEVQAQAAFVERLFALERDFLVTAANHKKPSDATLKSLMEPIANRIQAIQDIREKNRASKLFTHLSAISESIPALGWIAVSPTPAPYIKEMIDAGQFYTNRVLKDYKDKEPMHVEWARAWIDVLQQLQAYVKKTHTTGVAWNPRGGDLSTVPQSSSINRNLATGGAPPPPGPPPPGPPPQLFKCNFPPEPNQSDARAALFQSINQGDDITRGLKKVTADMQTHKNPNLRGGATVTDSPTRSAGAIAASKIGPNGPPKVELNGKKWEVHNQQSNQKIVIDQTEMNHSVYIYRCADSVVQVKGKVSSITVDSCSKTSVVCESLVSYAEVVNSQRTQIQVMGKVPTVQIDKSDGVQIYLSKDSLDCEIFSAKSSEMNVSVPKADGDYAEHPVPEQFKTKWDTKRGKLVTEVNEATG
ncbi:adenylyl cyclase-associated protein 2-like isoform X2 [Paramacrobiotus metropolitanus]|uniref:adenylyl cyclase-associated protein 2-like isoform X2 n=1 Tax=Paramacrobiotus metropolitanus TaxID=2943436 RepID=UPI0024462607|nr:adenylyl cyclase-associated protein 2-like isoform X2 [Paramacrobiotus metropolitanus]XP_055331463.1 adenylyl cyclase-associated protein 2-like isoform X2 [Paramacrobiotus metropolitanus]